MERPAADATATARRAFGEGARARPFPGPRTSSGKPLVPEIADEAARRAAAPRRAAEPEPEPEPEATSLFAQARAGRRARIGTRTSGRAASALRSL